MDRLALHREAVDRALRELGLGWGAWPDAALDSRLTPEDRLSALLVLLGTHEQSWRRGPLLVQYDPFAQSVDGLGRLRQPWAGLTRFRYPWTASTATLAVESATLEVLSGPGYDDRRVSLALTGAAQVCESGLADAGLLDELDLLGRHLDRLAEDHTHPVAQARRVRQVLAMASPPDLLDLLLVVDGDGWGGPAREAARAAPAEDVAPLVRTLGRLGPGKPPASWRRDVRQALEVPAARRLARRWLELAAQAPVVPEWPGSQVGHCLGVLLLGTNIGLVRAAALAVEHLPEDDVPATVLGTLVRRGAAHNGMAGMTEALCLPVASAAVTALGARDGEADRRVMAELLVDVGRRDLTKRLRAALGA